MSETTDKKNITYGWPTESKRITSPFGPRIHPIKGVQKPHCGIDIGAIKIGTNINKRPEANKIVAICDGKVRRIRTDLTKENTAGVYIEYETSDINKFVVRCMHMDPSTLDFWKKNKIQAGRTVKAGEVLGFMGTTGSSNGVHLHIDFQTNQISKYKDKIVTYPGLYSGYLFVNPELILNSTFDEEKVKDIYAEGDKSEPVKPDDKPIPEPPKPKPPNNDETLNSPTFSLASSAFTNMKKYDYVNVGHDKGNIYSNYYRSTSKMASFALVTPSDVLNYYADRTILTKWDVRNYDDYSTIIVGRNNYFYKNGDRFKHAFENYIEENDSIKETIAEVFLNDDENDTFDKVLCSYTSALKYNKKVHPGNINTAVSQLLEDKGVVTPDSTVFNDYIDRKNKCMRKVSENHLAISNFNLIYSAIQYNDEIYNTVTVGKNLSKTSSTSQAVDGNFIFDLERDSITVCKHTDTRFIKEYMFEGFDNFITDSTDDVGMLHEYMSNKLLTELSYMYQGKIFITFNSDIEIGDTVTLIDATNKRLGIFDIDTFEHILDRRGLITVLNVKASINVVEPCLDAINQNMITKIYKQLETKMKGEKANGNAIERDIHFKNVLALFNRYSVIYSKYSSFYNTDAKGELFEDNTKSPTIIPVKIYPYIENSMLKFGDKTIFFTNAASGELFSNYLNKFYISLKDRTESFLKSAWQTAYDIGVFTLDIVFDFATFGLHELLKPVLGINYKKAQTMLFGKEDDKVTEEELNVLQEFKPYDNEAVCNYNVKNSVFDIGFMNLQMKTFNDLYDAAYPGRSKDEDVKAREYDDYSKNDCDKFDALNEDERDRIYNLKKTSLQQIAQQFTKNGIFCAVEGYSTFKCNDSNKNIEDITKNFGDVVNKFSIYKDSYAEEFGFVSYSKEFETKYKPTFKLFKFNNNNVRQYVEVTLNLVVENDKTKNDKYSKQFTKEIKIMFFHNYYGNSGIGKSNDVMKVRKSNVEELLTKYFKPGNKYENSTPIIMADFNLRILNEEDTIVDYEDYMLDRDYKCYKNIKKPTTLKITGVPNKQYDNIIVPKEFKNNFVCNVFSPVYSDLKYKRITSDHMCVAASIVKR